MAESSFYFFASCALGAENILEQEIESLRPFTLGREGLPSTGPFKILSRAKGGVEFSADLEVGLALNHWLKTAHRILLRVSQFEAKSPPRLFDRLKSVSLQTYQNPVRPSFQVEARHCKVHNEKQIRRFAEDLWDLDEKSDLRLYLRGEKDQWTLSLDTSGEHLHKRGRRLKAGAAPLRESLAAVTLRLVTESEPRGRRRTITLLDPMAGTGSLLSEAWILDQPIRSRSFVYQNWKNCPKILLSPTYWKNLAEEWQQGQAWGALVAGEIDPGVFDLLKVSLQALEPEAPIILRKGDSFALRGRKDWGVDETAPLWIISNPPYGERLSGTEWVDKLPLWVKNLRAERVIVWVPHPLRESFINKMGRDPILDHEISNGGIHCHILVFKG